MSHAEHIYIQVFQASPQVCWGGPRVSLEKWKRFPCHRNPSASLHHILLFGFQSPSHNKPSLKPSTLLATMFPKMLLLIFIRWISYLAISPHSLESHGHKKPTLSINANCAGRSSCSDNFCLLPKPFPFTSRI